MRPSQIIPPPINLAPPTTDDADAPGSRPAQIIPPPADLPASAPPPPTAAETPPAPRAQAAAPPPPLSTPQRPNGRLDPPLPPPKAQRPLEAPFQDEAPDRRPPSQRTPSAPIVPNLAPPPSPFESDPGGALLPEGRFTRAIEAAGGRRTQRVAAKVAGEIGDVYRQPIGQMGYRGDTGGWRTLAHQAAAAWEQQYHDAPDTLRPSERAAYERNPASLHQSILAADSPFRDYRESWIGAARAGDKVPGADDFNREVRAFPESRPAEMATRPWDFGTNDREASGAPREKTPSPVMGPGGRVMDRPPEMAGLPWDWGTNDLEATGAPRERTPASSEPRQVVPYADQPLAEGEVPGQSPLEQDRYIPPPMPIDLSTPEVPPDDTVYSDYETPEAYRDPVYSDQEPVYDDQQVAESPPEEPVYDDSEQYVADSPPEETVYSDYSEEYA